MAHHSAVTSCLYCTNNPSPPLSPSGPAFSGAHPIVITFANLSNVHFCGKVTNCSLCYCICILNEENPSDEALGLFFFFLDVAVIRNQQSWAIIRCAVCEICKSHYACTSASANWLSFNCFPSFSTHVSYSLSRDRELAPKCHRSFSFRINLLLFCLL